jgi:hypothetical protein
LRDSDGDRVFRTIGLALVSAFFTLAIVHYSMRHGRLIFHPTYDDVFYFADGLERLNLLYRTGLQGVLGAQVAEPPHSAFSTYLAAASFALFGQHDWAPYAGNVVVVFAVLMFADRLLGASSSLVRWSVLVLVLSVPALSVAVAEFRPDLPCGFLTAAGAVLLLEPRAKGATTGRLREAGLCFGLALLVKPPILPLTVVVLTASTALAVLRDVPSGKRNARTATAYALPVVGTALLVGAIPLIGSAAYYFRYFMLAIFGSNKPVPDYAADAWHQAIYYLVGTGGKTMFGQHLFLLGFAIAAAAWRDAGNRAAFARQSAVALLAYLIPTISPVKQHFFGVTFVFIVLFMAVQAIALAGENGVCRWRGHNIGGGAAAALAISGLLVAKGPLYWGEPNDKGFADRKALARALYGQIVRNAGGRPSTVFLTANGSINQYLLRYFALKDGEYELRFRNLAFHEDTGDVEQFRGYIGSADMVVAGERGNSEAFEGLPSGQLQDVTLDLVRHSPRFVESGVFATLTPGKRIYLFQRVAPP